MDLEINERNYVGRLACRKTYEQIIVHCNKKIDEINRKLNTKNSEDK